MDETRNIDHFDVVIIGAGQAADPLARALAKGGKRVAVAERKHLGGSCVNFGCTPTKAAIASARVAQQARRAREYGLDLPVVRVDYPAVLERAKGIVAQSVRHLQAFFDETQGAILLRGQARLEGRAEGGLFRVRVGERAVTASQVVLETGTRTQIPPIEGLDDVDCLTSGNWLHRPDLPEHLVLLGSGYIGMEMGQFYRRMGSRVTLIDHSNQVLAREDEDIAQSLQKCLEEEGVVFRLESELSRVEQNERGLTLHVRDKSGAVETLSASHLFVATGRRPNTDDLGLETVGVLCDEHGFAQVDARLATNVPGVWAAGDVRGGPMFTHTAWDDYRILESQILGDGLRTTDRLVPYAVFTEPQLGRAGLNEREAKEKGAPYRSALFEMNGNSRATEDGLPKGLLKLTLAPGDGRILGASLLCPEAAELAHIFVELIRCNAPYTQIRDAVYIHPTYAEGIQSAVLGM